MQANVLTFVMWDEEEEGVDVKHARSISRELVAIINNSAQRELKEYENQGYGNYSMPFVFITLLFSLELTLSLLKSPILQI